MKSNWRVIDSRKKRIERIVRKIKRLENKLVSLRQNNFKLVW
jgi:hypothetical protein